MESGAEQQAQYRVEQRKHPGLKEMTDFLQDNILPEDCTSAKYLSAQASQFTVMDGILYYINERHNNRKRVAVPFHLQEQLLRENNHCIHSGHFFGNRLYNTLLRHWWWPKMYVDAMALYKKCPECAIVTGAVDLNTGHH